MQENNENSQTQTNQPTPDPEKLREKLILAINQLSDKIPDLLDQIPAKEPMAKMAIMSFRPFLPKLETSLMNALETAEHENILKLVDYVEALHTWLTSD